MTELAELRSNRDRTIRRFSEVTDDGRTVERVDASNWNQYGALKDQIAALDAEAEIAMKRMEAVSHVTRRQTFDNFTIRSSWQGRIYESAKQYAENPRDYWFYAGGQSGCGKTHLCMAICRMLGDRGQRIRVSHWKEDSRTLRTMTRATEQSRDILLYSLKESPTLFLDDVLRGSPTEAEKTLFFEIVDHRYRTRKRTIISSEYTLQRLTETFDEAVGGRIAEMCGGYVVSIGSDSKKNYRVGGGHGN